MSDSGFNPGIARVIAAGEKVTIAAYPEGAAGIQLSLKEVASKVREARLDPDLRDWAFEVLRAAGNPPTTRGRAAALLAAWRRRTDFYPDPVGTEMINAPGVSLCLRGKAGLCVRATDCDDCIGLGGVLMSIGIPVVVVKQTFGLDAMGNEQQEHVILEAQDEQGHWLPIDPTTPTFSVGDKHAVDPSRGGREERLDPMDMPGQLTGTTGPEIVTLGAPPRVADAVLYDRDGQPIVGVVFPKAWIKHVGVGLHPSPDNPNGFPPGVWTPQADKTITIGLRYFVIVIVPATWGRDDVARAFDGTWFVEALNKRDENTTENLSSAWDMQGIARVSGQLVDVPPSAVAAVFREAPGATPDKQLPPPGKQQTPAQPAQPKDDSGPSLGALFVGGIAVGVIGAVGYGLWKGRKKR